LRRAPLRFGTDGWRGVIARDATFDAFRRLAGASLAVYRQGGFGPGATDSIVVGHDPRFLSEELAALVADVFASGGVSVRLTGRPVPTPAVSLAVRRHGLSGGVAVTASHNPAVYNGFKLKAHFGGSAPPALYDRIQREIDRPRHRTATRKGRVRVDDLWGPYLECLSRLVDLEKIRGEGPRVLADAMHGAAADGLEQVVGSEAVTSLRSGRDVLFGGVAPEPIGPNLEAAGERVRRDGLDMAVATDGDADRLGVLDADGRFVSPHRVLALLVLHAFRERGVRGGVARTFSTSLLIDRIARGLGARSFETGIGFKHVAELMISGRAAVGGEESGGYGFAFHLPERDGLLSALLLMEHLAATGRTLSEALEGLRAEFGAFEYARSDIALPAPVIEAFLGRVRRRPPRSVAGVRVEGVRELDGVKLSFGARGWLLLRQSGTEPLIRLYCEHEDAGTCRRILERAEERLRRFADEEAA
jgi:phosphomannomutase